MTGAFSFQERSHMNVFEVVKENVTARQAAEIMYNKLRKLKKA